MKGDDYLLAMTASLLARAEAEFPAALARAREGYELDAPRAPKMRSVGARLADGRELGLAAWLRDARGGAPRSARVAEGAREERPDLPAFQAAGFAGTGRTVLTVVDGPRRGVYAFATMFAPRTAMTPDAFARWIDRQDARAGLWPKIAEEVDQFQRMNGRPGVTAATVRALLVSEEGTRALDYHGDNLVRRVQSELKRAGAALALSAEERALFDSDDPDVFERELFRDPAAAFVPSEQQLRVNGELTKGEFIDMVEAQEARAALWKALGAELANLRGPEAAAPAEPAAALRALPAEEFRLFATMLLGAAQRAALGAGAPLRVPESLRARVATSFESLSAEERAGYVPGPERLRLAANPSPWEFYALIEIPGAESPPAEPLAPARAAWAESLGAAQRLAKRLESPFAEAFRLAAFALDHAGADDAALAAAGFEENARRVWADESALIADLGLADEKRRALLSVSIGDVFGGMGSWNDQTPQDEADAADFARVSGELFVRLRALYAAALSLP